MKKLFLAGALLASTTAQAIEIGLKLGNTRINWDANSDTTMEGYVAVYGEFLLPLGFISVGPMVELGYAKKSIGRFYCVGYGTCDLDFTYTTLEVNGKAVLSLGPMFELFGGAGISSNRFGLDAKNPITGDPVGTIDSETRSGAQAFVGAQMVAGGLGVGLEYKLKVISSDYVDSIDTITLIAFARF